MDIRRGNESIVIKQGPPPLPEKQLSHTAYAAWDCFLDMIRTRSEAIELWERVANLNRLIEKHPNHTNTPEAIRRRAAAMNQFRELQLRFVKIEAMADGHWTLLPAKERRKEAIDDMFGVESDAQSILGAWHRQLGESEGAPRTCTMDSTVLQFVPPSVKRAYRPAMGT